jgi:ParB family protein of integrating conjugative element (PFGI_1 class)
MSDLAPQILTADRTPLAIRGLRLTADSRDDPTEDTFIVATLDQLRPYALDPRLTRNRRYDEIKSSIRQRGLDASPVITRRPGEPSLTIRNGGNTRLSILRELWAETKDEQFFYIHCLFRPWAERGEIIALTGHLAESDLHGSLCFIERALGVEKARELYEKESKKTLTQAELSQHLGADGYPIGQSQISRMQDAIQYLLPAIPTLLYAGMGKPQVERLRSLYKAGMRTWATHLNGRSFKMEFGDLYRDVLALFDATDDEGFSIERVRDELVGQMAEILGCDYDALALQLDDIEHRNRLLSRDPTPSGASASLLSSNSDATASASPTEVVRHLGASPFDFATHQLPPNVEEMVDTLSTGPAAPRKEITAYEAVTPHLSLANAAAPSPGRGMPLPLSGRYPATKVWHIPRALDTPAALRQHIYHFAREIAGEAALADRIPLSDAHVGIRCAAPCPAGDTDTDPKAQLADTLAAMLNRLSASEVSGSRTGQAPSSLGGWEFLLLGAPGKNGGATAAPRLSDDGVLKFFRLVRLIRRLREWESEDACAPPSPTN